MVSLKSDYAYCEAIIRQNSASFYKAFSRLPTAKRQAVFAIYAFCRQADDAIDIHDDPRALEELDRRIDRLFSQWELSNLPTTDDDPVFRALADSLQRFELSAQPFRDMIRGQTMDLHFRQPATQAELEDYCYFVAGTVGLMILPIIATRHHQDLNETAVSLGIAMQLTNILRDVGEDMDHGRLYLPRVVLEENDCPPEDIFNKRISPEFIAAWETEARLAETRYQEFLEHVGSFDADSRPAVLSSALYYRGILDAVRENGYDCLTKRCRVSNLDAIQILVAGMKGSAP